MYNAIKIREKIERRETVIMGNVVLSDPLVSELMGFCGCDIVWIDLEHAPLDSKDTAQHIMGAHASGAAAIVRVTGSDPTALKKILDAGADGIIFPQITTADEARTAIRGCCYPPDGIRGWNPIRASKYDVVDGKWYRDNLDQLLLRFIMLEDIGAANEIDEILDIPQLDGIIFGPCDLSGSIGKLGDEYAEDVQKVIRTVAKKSREKNKYLGVAVGYATPEETIKYWIEMGIQLISFGQDASLLTSAVTAGVKHVADAAAKAKQP